MGLDATVYCDCLERGQLRVVPDPAWHVYVDESGARFAKTIDLDADLAFDRWNASACEHERGVLLHHYLGNIARIGNLRESLAPHAPGLPIIFSKVIYNAIHGGDWLPVELLDALSNEVNSLTLIRFEVTRDAERLEYF